MNEFFGDISILAKGYWIIALLGSLLLVVIFAMTFLGGGDADMDADMDSMEGGDDGGVGFQFFTFKNVVAFFTIFGWTGITCINGEFSNAASLVIATIAGLIMMTVTSLLFFWIAKLAHSGTLKIDNAVGVVGEVYLTIGANRSKSGKVQIKVQGSLRELEAITDEAEDLKSQSMIKVIGVVSNELLLVEKLKK